VITSSHSAAATVTYLLKDLFTTAQAAPVTSPRTCEPGPGTLTITDSASTLSINSSNELVAGAAATGTRDPWIRNASGHTRAAGLCLYIRLKRLTTFGAGANSPLLGWGNTLTTPLQGQVYGAQFNSSTNVAALIASSANAPVLLDTVSAGTYYDVRVILRATGFWLAIGSTLVWVGNAGSEATLYPMVFAKAANAWPTTIDTIWVTQLANSWTDDYGIVTSRAAAPAGGATAVMTADGIVEVTITAATGVTQELSVRYTDDDNRWIVRLDNTDCILVERNASTETERSRVATALTNGTQYRIVAITRGTTIKTYVADVLKNSYTSATFNQTATTAKVSHACSNLVCWPSSVSISDS
jgi:hypothetical protein